MAISKPIAIVLAWFLLCPARSFAQTAPVNFDLSSTDKVAPASSLLSGGNSQIQVGGAARTISPGDTLSAAEFAALAQVAQTGRQTLIVGSNGTATAGSLALTNSLSSTMHGLVIPAGVVAIRDAALGNLMMPGNLVNFGTIYGVTSSSQSRNVGFTAANIENMLGATISTMLPAGSLLGFSNIPGGVNLSLTAVNSLINRGAITSSASLNLGAANIVNDGVVSSLSSTITMSHPIALNISGNGAFIAPGQIAATAGNMLNVIGTTFAAPSLLFKALDKTHVAATELIGAVTVAGSNIRLGVQQGDLNIVELRTDGDPLLSNSTGNVLLPAVLNTSGGPLSVIAAGSIIGDDTVIDTGGIVDSGDVLLLAGAANDTVGGITTVSGASGLTGDITGIERIATDSIITDGSQVTVGTFSGKIEIGDINTSSNSGTAGSVTVIGPGNITIGDVNAHSVETTGASLQISNSTVALSSGGLELDADGNWTSGLLVAGIAGAGTLRTADLDLSGRAGVGGSIDIENNGSILLGAVSTRGGLATQAPGDGFDGGAIAILSNGGNLIVDGTVDAGGAHGLTAPFGSSAKGGDGGNAGPIALEAAGNIALGDVTANGGGGGGGGGSVRTGIDAGDGGDGGNGGTITILAGGKLTAGKIYAAGGNGGGGGGGCCNGGTGGHGGTGGSTGSGGGGAIATGALIGEFPWGTLPGGHYTGPGGGNPGMGGYGGGGGAGGWWGWEHGGDGGTGGDGADILLTAESISTATVMSIGGGSGGGGGMTASGGGGASAAAGGRGEDKIVPGDAVKGGAPGPYTGGGGGAYHYFAGTSGDYHGGHGGGASFDNGGPFGGGGGGGWKIGGSGGGFGPTGYGGDITLTSTDGAIDVAGSVNSFSFTKQAGSIAITSAAGVRVDGQVQSNSGFGAGSISIVAGANRGAINIASNVNASSGGPGGAGSITIDAPSGAIFVGAPLTGAFGNGKASLNTSSFGGDGGNISLSSRGTIGIGGDIVSRGGSLNSGIAGDVAIMSGINTPGGFGDGGAISINGYVDTRGGGTANSAGGDVVINGGSLVIRGIESGERASIVTSGRTNLHGTIQIRTEAIQPFPTYFDLNSMQKIEYALPGSIFSVGDATANGTAGLLVSGNSSVPKKTTVDSSAPYTDGSGRISLSTTGSTAQVNEGGNLTTIVAVDSKGKRVKITPAQALALFQTTHGLPQTVGINEKGQLAGLDPQGDPSRITLNDYHLPSKFTVFKLNNVGPNLFVMNVVGPNPVLRMAGTAPLTVAGQLNFIDPNATIVFDMGKNNLTLLSTGSIAAADSSSIAISSAQKAAMLRVEGLLQAGSISFSGPKAFTIMMKTTGSIVGPVSGGTLSLLADSFKITGGSIENMSISLKPLSAVPLQLSINTNFGPGVLMPSLTTGKIELISTGSLLIPAGSQLTAATISLKAANFLEIGGSVQADTITLNGGSELSALAKSGVHANKRLVLKSPLTTVAGSVFAPTIDLTRALKFSVAGAGSLTSTGNLTIAANPIATFSGAISGAKVNINSAGTLNFGTAIVTAAKELKINAKSDIDFGDADLVSKDGGLLIKSLGNISFGSGASLESNGGNLIVQARGSVFGDAGATFTSNVARRGIYYYGGAIQIGSGMTKATPVNMNTASLKNPPFFTLEPNPLNIGLTTVTHNGGVGGLIRARQLEGGVINVSQLGTATAFSITGSMHPRTAGMVFLDAHTAGQGIYLDGATFNAGQPISFVEIIESSEHGAPDFQGKLPMGSIVQTSPDAVCGWNRDGFSLRRGDVFIKANTNHVVTTPMANVNLKKGANVLIRATRTSTDVYSFIASKVVVSSAHGLNNFALGCSMQLSVVAGHQPISSCFNNNVGRRLEQIIATNHESTAAICDFSITSLLLNSEIRQLCERNQNVLNDILKTAAAYQLITQSKGTFRHRNQY